MKIYTKTGDDGETGLFGGARVSKASARVWSYGELDELNAGLGVARAHLDDTWIDGVLATIQSELFDLGAELARDPGRACDPEADDVAGAPSKSPALTHELSEDGVARLERAIDEAESSLAPLRNFILPGGTLAAAQLHAARTVCRRAERRVVALAAEAPVRPVLVRYLNRLSDLCFVLARLVNHRAGVPDVPWQGRKARG